MSKENNITDKNNSVAQCIQMRPVQQGDILIINSNT